MKLFLTAKTCRWLLLLSAMLGIWGVLATKGGQRWIKRLTQHGPQFTKEYVSAPIAISEPNQVGTELWKGHETYTFSVNQGNWLREAADSMAGQIWNVAGPPAMRKLLAEANANLETCSTKLVPSEDESNLMRIRSEMEAKPMAFHDRVQTAAVKAISVGIEQKLRKMLADTELRMDFELTAEAKQSQLSHLRAKLLGADEIKTVELEIPVQVELDYLGPLRVGKALPKALGRFSGLTFSLSLFIQPQWETRDFDMLTGPDWLSSAQGNSFEVAGRNEATFVSGWPRLFFSTSLPMSADWLGDDKISFEIMNIPIDHATRGRSSTWGRNNGQVAISISPDPPGSVEQPSAP
jgi:hypothetical protein